MPQDIFMEAFIEILKYTFPAALMLLLTYLLLSNFVDNEEKTLDIVARFANLLIHVGSDNQVL